MKRYIRNWANDKVTGIRLEKDEYGAPYITIRQADNALRRMDAIGSTFRHVTVEGGCIEPTEFAIREDI